MTRTAQDVEMWEGTYTEIAFTVVDSDEVAVNLTGATLTWRMCSGGPSGEVILTKSSPSSGVSIVSAAAGTGKITLAESDTVDRGRRSYYHELVIEDSGGHSEVGFIGTVKINKSAIL